MGSIDITYAVVVAVLAALSTFAGTLFSQQVTDWVNRRAQRKTFNLYAGLEIKNLIKNMDAFLTAYSKDKFYDYNLIASLEKSVEKLDDARGAVHLIKSQEVQEKLFEVVGKTNLLVKDLRGTQDYEYNKDGDQAIPESKKVEFIKEKRNLHLIEITDLKRQLEDLARSFRN